MQAIGRMGAQETVKLGERRQREELARQPTWKKRSGVSLAHRRRADLQRTRLVQALFVLILTRGDGREEE